MTCFERQEENTFHVCKLSWEEPSLNVFIWNETLWSSSNLPAYLYHPGFSSKINPHLAELPKLLQPSCLCSLRSFHLQFPFPTSVNPNYIRPSRLNSNYPPLKKQPWSKWSMGTLWLQSQRSTNHDFPPLTCCKQPEHMDRVLMQFWQTPE